MGLKLNKIKFFNNKNATLVQHFLITIYYDYSGKVSTPNLPLTFVKQFVNEPLCSSTFRV